MEQNKGTTNEREMSHVTGVRSTGSEHQAATATQRQRDVTSKVVQSAGEAYEQTRQVVSDAYDKTANVLNDTYEQAVSYGRENPGKMTLVAFGAGIGIGILLAAGIGSGRTRKNRIVEPIVSALSDIAMELFR
ncbi:MAG TPA: hypothetical protein VI756_08970 [Blastocatellia bacterium]